MATANRTGPVPVSDVMFAPKMCDNLIEAFTPPKRSGGRWFVIGGCGFFLFLGLLYATVVCVWLGTLCTLIMAVWALQFAVFAGWGLYFAGWHGVDGGRKLWARHNTPSTSGADQDGS